MKQSAGNACGRSVVVLIGSREGFHARNKLYKEAPPIHVCMPNHPHATMARSMAGMLAPFVPKLALASTGKGIPYLAPACPFSNMGTNTITLPIKIVRTACHQLMPWFIIELAIV